MVTKTDVVGIAQALADEFRPRAAEYDRLGQFPAENYERMRQTGYLRALVPEELGGFGATLPEIARAQQALARGDASTALMVNMHQFQVGAGADGYRRKGLNEAALRRVAEEGIVLASAGAEAIVAGAWTTPTTAVREDGHYVVNGRKYFVSQADGMDMLRVNALDAETGEIVVIAVPRKADGVRVEPTWDTLGMRATVSHEVVLENVKVPETAAGARLPTASPVSAPEFANVMRWFLPLASSVYLGIAEEARAEAYASLGKGRNTSFRDEALTDVMIGQMETSYMTAVSVRDQAAAQLAEFPEDMQGAVAIGIACRQVVVENAIATVEQAMQIAGGTSYFRKSALERLWRDVQAGRYHPPAQPVSYQMVGQRMRERAASK